MASSFKSTVRMVVIVFGLMLSGCATQKALSKDQKMSVVDERALKIFKEGAALMFVDNEAALAKFLKARELDPSLIAAHFNTGLIYEQMGKDEEASKAYAGCLAINKEEGACLDNLIVVKIRLGDVASADALIADYLAKSADLPFVQVSVAKYYFLKDDLASSEKYAREAIERDASNVEALYLMMRIFFARKQYAAAKWVAKNALEIAPSHGGLYLWQGHIFVELGLLHDALDSYANALKFQPTPEALESYGLLLLKRGKVSEALTILERLVELRPANDRNHLHLGNVYMALKDFAKAKASYDKALELNPQNNDVNFNLGILYFDLKADGISELERFKKAKEYFSAYLSKGSLNKERISEVNNYLKTIDQKIEIEESASQHQEEPEPEENIEGSEPENEDPITPEDKEPLDNADVLEVEPEASLKKEHNNSQEESSTKQVAQEKILLREEDLDEQSFFEDE